MRDLLIFIEIRETDETTFCVVKAENEDIQMIFDNKISKTIRFFVLSASVLTLYLFACQITDAQTVPVNPNQTITNENQYRDALNENTVTILGASLSGSYIKIVDDIAKAVNDGNKLRVLPIVGEGGSQNIRDLLYLKGVDAGIVMSTSLDTYNGQPLFKYLPIRLQYIARLYEEEFHIVGNPNIQSVADLAGKKVGFHGGAYVSGRELLAKLNVKPAEEIQINFFKGLDAVKSGDLAAIIRATASPMKDFDDTFDAQFHKLVPVPFEESLFESHLPAKLTHEQYPKVIPEGETVDTAAIGVVLATYAWKPGTDRYRRVAQFTEAFFENIDKLLANPKRHPKWDDVNLAAELPGWKRFPAAEEWLKNHPRLASNASAASRQEFSTFLQSRGDIHLDDTQKEKLFEAFMEWKQSRN